MPVAASASHIVEEYLFDSLTDFEAGLAGMSGSQFRSHSEALAPYVVAGSHHWVVYRVVAQGDRSTPAKT